MTFEYYDKNNNIQRLNIEVGKEWSSYKDTNDRFNPVNSIFDAVDQNADGKVDKEEFDILQKLLKIADSQIDNSKNNNIIEKEELQLLNSKIETHDINTLKTNLGEKLTTQEIIDIPNDKYENYTYLDTIYNRNYKTKIITVNVDYSCLNNLEDGKYYIKRWNYSWNKEMTVKTMTPVVTKVQNSNQDGTKNWSEGINRNITRIQLNARTTSDELKSFMEKVGEEQGFTVEMLDTFKWIEDYSTVRADKKQLIPYQEYVFASKLNKNSKEQLNIVSTRTNISDDQQGGASYRQMAEKYSKIVSQDDLIYGKTYLEGGNVLNTLTKDGKPAAVIGEESIKYTMLAMGLKDSEESIEIAKKQIAEELGIEEENITYIQQFDFHIDMLYRPLNDGQMGVPDYEGGIKVLNELIQDIDSKIETMKPLIEAMKPDIRGILDQQKDLQNKKQEYIKLIEQLEATKKETEDITRNAETELIAKGYEIVKIPCFSVADKTANPINYMNGICGTSAKTGDKYYITNTSGNEELDAYMEKYFKETVGFDKVYFAPTKEYLVDKGGIDCLTKEF